MATTTNALIWCGCGLTVTLLCASPLWAAANYTPAPNTAITLKTLAWGNFYPLTKPLWQPQHANLAVVPFSETSHTPVPTPVPATIIAATSAPTSKQTAEDLPELTLPIAVKTDGHLSINPAVTLSTNINTNTLTLRNALFTPTPQGLQPLTLTLQLPTHQATIPATAAAEVPYE